MNNYNETYFFFHFSEKQNQQFGSNKLPLTANFQAFNPAELFCRVVACIIILNSLFLLPDPYKHSSR